MKIITIRPERGSDLPAGSIIDGRYKVLGTLGRGGFAVVYRARHLHMGREVALKLLNEGLPESHADSIRRRFITEAQVLGQLNHPNIVGAHDFGFHGEANQAYIVMASLSGAGLDELLRDHGAMSPSRALRLLLPCLEALAQAHQSGIIHKDLKPSNFFVTQPGTAAEKMMILDFGAVTLSALPSPRLTQKGELIGTPQYLAPEYIKDHEVSPALDVYQVGLVFVEMLTGELAVGTRNPYLCLMSHCRGNLVIPASLRHGPLGPFIGRALEVDPLSRYPDARAMLEALDRPLGSEPIDVTAAAPVLVEKGEREGSFEAVTAVLVGGGAEAAKKDVVLESVEEVVMAGVRGATTVISLAHKRRQRGYWSLLSVASILLVCAGSLALAIGVALASDALPSAAVDMVLVSSDDTDDAAPETPRPQRQLERLEVVEIHSSRHLRGRGPRMLLDHDQASTWRPRGRSSSWIEVEFQRQHQLGGLALFLGGGGQGVELERILLSVDGEPPIALHLRPRAGLHVLSLPVTLMGRRLRIDFPDGVRDVGELQFWGSDP